MSAWPVARLEVVAKIERNGIAPEDIKSGTKYLGLEHIESGGRIIGEAVVQNGELASNKFKFGPDHILYGKLRPYLAKIAAPDFEGVCSTDILPVLPSNMLEKGYLLHFLRQPAIVDMANSRAEGANLPRLSPKALAQFEIPLPPLDEQKRIAAILDQADALRRLRKRSLDRLNTLSQAIFYEMFGDELCRNALPLSELIEEFRYGTSNKSGESGYPTLRIPNVVAGSIDLDDLKTVSVTQTEYNKLRLRPGDLLFVRTNGNPDNVGRCAVYEPEIVKSAGYEDDEFIYASYLIRARLNQYLINPKYLASYLTTSVGRRALREQSKTSAGQYNINTEGLGVISIPLPEIDRQNKFVERIELIKKHGIILQKENDKLDSLFASLQHRAFRGGL